MTTWTSDDLDCTDRAGELEMAPRRGDGILRGPVPIWVVRDSEDLYVRSVRGTDGGWWRAARPARPCARPHCRPHTGSSGSVRARASRFSPTVPAWEPAHG
jgi:hypothetical protein